MLSFARLHCGTDHMVTPNDIPDGAYRSRALPSCILMTDVCGGLASASRRLAVRDRGPKVADQLRLDQRLGQIALDPQSQHALADAIIRIRGNENRWDRVP